MWQLSSGRDSSASKLWRWGEAEITIVHRSAIRLYYRSENDARRDHYEGLDDASVSGAGRVNSFCGLRGVAKQLYNEIRRGCERRVQLVQMEGRQLIGEGAQCEAILEGASVLVLATGMQSNVVPVLRTDGTAVELQMDQQVDRPGMSLRLTGVCRG